MIVIRDVKFDEGAVQNWDKKKAEEVSLDKNTSQEQDEDENEEGFESKSDTKATIRGMRLLSNIYEKCNLIVVEPSNYVEATSSKAWIVAIKEKLSMIEKNETWQLVDRSKNKKVIGVKWVYIIKFNGSVNKLKARLVVKGYSQ